MPSVPPPWFSHSVSSLTDCFHITLLYTTLLFSLIQHGFFFFYCKLQGSCAPLFFESTKASVQKSVVGRTATLPPSSVQDAFQSSPSNCFFAWFLSGSAQRTQLRMSKWWWTVCQGLNFVITTFNAIDDSFGKVWICFAQIVSKVGLTSSFHPFVDLIWYFPECLFRYPQEPASISPAGI